MGNTIPILGWGVGNIFMTLQTFSPEEMGGIGDVLAKARVLAKKTGRNKEELVKEVAIFVDYSFVILTVLSLAELSNGRSSAQCAWTSAVL
jgi:hypothetical protein